MKIYLASKGKITEHNVLLQADDILHIDRLDDEGKIVALDVKFIGDGIYNTFKEAKEATIKKFEDAIEKRTAEVKVLQDQTEPVIGELKD